jgi:hypothetical protein
LAGLAIAFAYASSSTNVRHVRRQRLSTTSRACAPTRPRTPPRWPSCRTCATRASWRSTTTALTQSRRCGRTAVSSALERGPPAVSLCPSVSPPLRLHASHPLYCHDPSMRGRFACCRHGPPTRHLSYVTLSNGTTPPPTGLPCFVEAPLGEAGGAADCSLLVLELCDLGNLMHALRDGVFHRPLTSGMIGVNLSALVEVGPTTATVAEPLPCAADRGVAGRRAASRAPAAGYSRASATRANLQSHGRRMALRSRPRARSVLAGWQHSGALQRRSPSTLLGPPRLRPLACRR